MPDVFCTDKIMERAYYKTTHMIVIYNKYPSVPGHSLIIPKRHVESVLELTEKEHADMFNVMKKVIPVLLQIYATDDSLDLVMQTGAYSGMTINHLHVHIIPRNKNDKYQFDDSALYMAIKEGKLEGYKTDSETEIKRLRKIFNYKGD